MHRPRMLKLSIVMSFISLAMLHTTFRILYTHFLMRRKHITATLCLSSRLGSDFWPIMGYSPTGTTGGTALSSAAWVRCAAS